MSSNNRQQQGTSVTPMEIEEESSVMISDSSSHLKETLNRSNSYTNNSVGQPQQQTTSQTSVEQDNKLNKTNSLNKVDFNFLKDLLILSKSIYFCMFVCVFVF